MKKSPYNMECSAAGFPVKCSPHLLSSHFLLQTPKYQIVAYEEKVLLYLGKISIPQYSVHTYGAPGESLCVCVWGGEFMPNGCAAQKSKRASTQRLLISIWVEGVHSWLSWEDRNYTLPEGRWQGEENREGQTVNDKKKLKEREAV